MTPFKALLVKDFHTLKKGILIPVWIVAGIYVLYIIGAIIAAIHGDLKFTLIDLPEPFMKNSDLQNVILFGTQVAIYAGFMGILVTLSMIINSSILLNSDVRNKCELFHRSQPVSVWQLTGSRYIVGVLGTQAVAFLLGLLNMTIFVIIIAVLTPIKVNLWLSINGFMLSYLHVFIPLMIIGSLCFVLSAIFRENAFGKGIAVLSGIELASHVMNYLLSWKLPSPMGALFKYILSGYSSLQMKITAMKFGAFSITGNNSANAVSTFKLPSDFMANAWSSLFTMGSLSKLVIAGLLFIIGTIIYQRREIQ